jgi:hypothetical protein
MGITTFRCPQCGELLEFAPQNQWLVLLISIATGAILVFLMGYRGLTLVFGAIGAAFLTLVLVVSVAFHIWPPKAQQCFRKGDTELRLTEKSRR